MQIYHMKLKLTHTINCSIECKQQLTPIQAFAFYMFVDQQIYKGLTRANSNTSYLSLLHVYTIMKILFVAILLSVCIYKISGRFY